MNKFLYSFWNERMKGWFACVAFMSLWADCIGQQAAIDQVTNHWTPWQISVPFSIALYLLTLLSPTNPEEKNDKPVDK